MFARTRIRNTDRHIIGRKILDFKEKVETQRKNSQYLIQKLSDINLKLPVEMDGTYCNYYLFPVLFKNESERDKVSDLLRGNGIDTAKFFSKTPEIARLNYGYKGGCPDTEWVAERVLVVPNHYTLRERELEKISEIIKTCLSFER